MLSSWSRETIAPTSVFLSSGSPTRSTRSRCLSLAMTRSATGSCTSRREPAQHTWPWLKKMPLMMPSTAWSMGASSNTMFAALPPSSIVIFFSAPATERMMTLPTSVEPVNAIFTVSGCAMIAPPVEPEPVITLTTPGGRSASRKISASFIAVMRRVGGGLDHHAVPGGERGRDLPRHHEEREIPRDHLPHHAQGREPAARGDILELVRPAGVIEEMRGRHRHVEVARLADRLAVVHRLRDGEFARAILQQPRDAEEVLAALLARHLAPHGGLRTGRRSAGGVDIGRRAQCQLGQLLFVRRVDRVEVLAAGGRDELAADEEIVAGLDLRVGRLGRGIEFPEIAEDQLGPRAGRGTYGRSHVFPVGCQSGHGGILG
jgi:hypothetical protein